MTTITVPELNDILDKLANDLKTISPESNPYDENSLLRAELIAIANRIDNVYQLFEEVVKQTFDSTATGLFLEARGSELGITRNPATQSIGQVSFTGVLSTIIPSGTECSDRNGNLYTTQASGGISAFSESVTLDAASGIVEVTFSSDHKLGNGFQIIISGATAPDLNGTFNCTIINETKISYTIINTTLTTTDSGTCDYELADIEVKSSDFGSLTVKNGGDIISLSIPISGIDTDGTVQQTGIGGGSDIETDEELRERIQDKRQNPATNFNAATITNEVKELSFVDKVFVARITPAVGQVTIYCLKDDLTPLIAGELDDVKDVVVEISPVNTDVADIFVENPTQVSTNFTFSAISPDTATMRQAIEDNLQSLFNNVDISTDVTEEQYNRAILNTIDPANLATLDSYTLTTPTSDITIANGEIATLGTVSF